VQVRRQVSTAIDADDLVGYGTQGLLEAAARFDDKHGVKFITFAYHRVKGAMFDGLRQMGHLKRSDYARAKMAERAHELLENHAERELGAGPAAPKGPEDDLRALHAAMAGVVASYVTSLEGLAAEGKDFAVDEPWADEVLELAETKGRVIAILDELPEKERHFVKKHYFEGKTLLEAGQELGLSKSWASRLHARALELIRAKLEADGP
jgi:RNA polymerase sigma factor for flagellar operon FliA